MCLYQTKILNPKYLPNEKNGGIPPKCEDERKKYIYTDCGWCVECRKKIANNWKIRLYEEIKTNKNCEMVTLTFRPEAIQELENEIFTKHYKGLERGELDVNILAAYSVRMFTERWRKKYKKAPRYFLITELGHEGSERIHLHGLFFNVLNINKLEYQKDIQEKWTYGNVDFGEWVDERSINYISKYITKVDKINEGYKQKIFVSKGLGKDYVSNKRYLHAWKDENTNTLYRTKKGTYIAIPKYYKKKLFTEEEQEKLWTYQLNKNEIWIDGTKYDKERQDDLEYRKEVIGNILGRREANKKAGFGDDYTVAKRYIITEKMKMKKEELQKNRHKKEAKASKRRLIKFEENNKEYDYEELSKSIGVATKYLGEYVGNLTENEKKRNEEMAEAEEMGVSVRTLRLIKKGIITPKTSK